MFGAGDRGDQAGQHRRRCPRRSSAGPRAPGPASCAGRRVDEAADDPAQRPLARLRAHLRHRPLGIGDAEEVEQQRQVLGEPGIEQQRAAGDLLARRLLGLALADPEEGAQHLQHRHERDRAAVGLRLGLEDLDARRRGSARRTRGSAGSCRRPGRRPAPTAEPSPAFARASACSSARHLLGAADEAGEAALAGQVQPRAGGADPGQLEDPDRLAGALDLELAEVLEVEVAGGQRRGAARSGRPCRARPAPPSAAPARRCGRSRCSRPRRRAPIAPATTSPELIPIRVEKLRPGPRRSSAAYSATSSSIRSAA